MSTSSPPGSQIWRKALLEPDDPIDRVRFVAKADSRLMAAAALLLRGIGLRNFNERYWTTVGRTIYYPAYVRDPRAHPQIIDHELVHVRQWERYGLWLWASYLLLPLPFGLAWFRFRWEREAYLPEIEQAEDRDARDRARRRHALVRLRLALAATADAALVRAQCARGYWPRPGCGRACLIDQLRLSPGARRRT